MGAERGGPLGQAEDTRLICRRERGATPAGSGPSPIQTGTASVPVTDQEGEDLPALEARHRAHARREPHPLRPRDGLSDLPLRDFGSTRCVLSSCYGPGTSGTHLRYAHGRRPRALADDRGVDGLSRLQDDEPVRRLCAGPDAGGGIGRSARSPRTRTDSGSRCGRQATELVRLGAPYRSGWPKAASKGRRSEGQTVPRGGVVRWIR